MLPDEENRALSTPGMMKECLEGIIFPRRSKKEILRRCPCWEVGRRYSTMHSVSRLLFLVFSDTCLDQSLDNPKESIKATVHLNPLVYKQIWVSLRRNLHAVMQAVY